MSEAKMKMEEREFFDAVGEFTAGHEPPEAMRQLAARLGIELVAREEELRRLSVMVTPYGACLEVEGYSDEEDPWLDLTLIDQNRRLSVAEVDKLRLLVGAWNRRYQPPLPKAALTVQDLARCMFNAVNPREDWMTSLDKHFREHPWGTAARAALRALGLEEREDPGEWSTQYMSPEPPPQKEAAPEESLPAWSRFEGCAIWARSREEEALIRFTAPGKGDCVLNLRRYAIHPIEGPCPAHQPPPPTIPTRERLALEARGAYVNSDDWQERWRNVADAAFRAFGLEPRKEEEHGT